MDCLSVVVALIGSNTKDSPVFLVEDKAAGICQEV
jgi:hypothetical protein